MLTVGKFLQLIPCKNDIISIHQQIFLLPGLWRKAPRYRFTAAFHSAAAHHTVPSGPRSTVCIKCFFQNGIYLIHPDPFIHHTVGGSLRQFFTDCWKYRFIVYFFRISSSNFLSASQRLYPLAIFLLRYSFSPIMAIALQTF